MARSQFERSLSLIDINGGTSKDDFYVLDIFRVLGGHDHTRFFTSHFSTLATEGVSLEPGGEYEAGEMANFEHDPAPQPGWHAEWRIEDYYHLLPESASVRLRLTDFSHNIEAGRCDAWVIGGRYGSNDHAWVPRIIARRRSDGDPLASTFVAVLEPWQEKRAIASLRRCPVTDGAGAVCADNQVAMEVSLADGRRDYHLHVDVDTPCSERKLTGPVHCAEADITFQGETCFVRYGGNGALERIGLCRATQLDCAGMSLRSQAPEEYVELVRDGQEWRCVRGDGTRLTGV